MATTPFCTDFIYIYYRINRFAWCRVCVKIVFKKQQHFWCEYFFWNSSWNFQISSFGKKHLIISYIETLFKKDLKSDTFLRQRNFLYLSLCAYAQYSRFYNSLSFRNIFCFYVVKFIFLWQNYLLINFFFKKNTNKQISKSNFESWLSHGTLT